jgi:hypothetical protein
MTVALCVWGGALAFMAVGGLLAASCIIIDLIKGRR